MKFNDLLRKKSLEQINSDLAKSEKQSNHLTKNLTLLDLTCLGIAAVIGAGIFGTIGNASASGGPAVTLLFIFTAVVCLFSAMCYAEFASRMPISGGAYSYAYVAFGEFFAWIIGWSLIMEYAVGNIAVAISWSDYLTSFLQNVHIAGHSLKLPDWICTDYLSASRGYKAAVEELASGKLLGDMSYSMREAYTAWTTAPKVFGIKIIGDIPAFSITAFLTWLVYIGIRESKIASNIMVFLKLAVILLVIAVGSFYIKPENWSPFAPNGVSGVLKGVSAVFFAYIGFDAISTTSEECINPRRDLPRAMFLALGICTVLYIAICLVLTGMVNYKELALGDPLAFVFQQNHLDMMAGIVSISAVIAMASVLLVFQIGQPRIWMTMSRDGLLPKRFGKIHPKYHTPAFASVITGIVVAFPSLFMNLTEVTDLTSIGTLFAFALVCGGALCLPQLSSKEAKSKFSIPYI
ncbi:MAG: amino acid permease, partial [Pseudomonadota bacterium]